MIASYLINAESKNGVPDILKSYPRNPGNDGAPSFPGVRCEGHNGKGWATRRDPSSAALPIIKKIIQCSVGNRRIGVCAVR